MSGLRRAEKEIRNVSEIEDFLSKVEVGRLGTCVDNQPYVVPLNFVYSEKKIYFHCANIGKKMENISKNPIVCFEVDESEIISSENPCNYSYKYKSIIAIGTIKFVDEPNEKLRVFRLLVNKYARGKESLLDLESIAKYQNLAIVEISINTMTGKKSPV